VSNKTYKDFFNLIKDFKKKQEEQKRKGLNDYNMVNVVRKETVEVGMHSNVIYSLINPDGLHYQGDLFLQFFIKDVIEPELKKDNKSYNDFGDIFEVQAEESTYENRRIDFTIKSNKYFIGIEMKIDAEDLQNQISDYYADLCKKAEKNNIDKNNVFIFYLTKDGKSASPYSYKGYKDYKKISFDKHILKWIDSCQKEVEHITNLNEAFENYKNIVEKITNKYKGKVMNLDEYLNNEQTEFSLEEIEKFLNEIDEMQEKVSETFLKELEKKLEIYKPKYHENCLDITINNYLVRFLLADSLKIQITDAVNPFQVVPNEIKKENILTGLKKIDSYFGPGWEKSYATLDLGKVKIQTHKSILEKNFKYMDDIKKCLENN